MIFVSVIIPIYNAEKTIRKCVESILIQGIKDMEILLIDDGSSDESLKICRELEHTDQRIRVFTGENAGVSSARNKGLNEAIGKYISFVDADDTIAEEMFSSLKKIADQDPDIIVFDYYEMIGKDCKVKHRFEDVKGNDIEKEELIKRMIWQLGGTCWQAIYKKELIDQYHISFVLGRTICEDYQFLLEYLKYSKKTMICKKCLYYYHIMESSTTGKYMPKLEKDKEEFGRWLIKYVQQFSTNQEIIDGADAYCAMSLLYTIYNVCKNGSPYKNYRQRIRYSKQQALKSLYKNAIQKSIYLRNEIPKMYYLQILSIRFHMIFLDVIYYSWIKKFL